jgi:septum site-determining protein MinD
MRTSVQPAVAGNSAVPARGRIVVCFGTGHGSGKTTIITKLGMSLVNHRHRSVCLVDVAPGERQLAKVLELRGPRVLADAAAGRRTSPEDLLRLAVTHQSGVDVVVGAVQPKQLQRLAPDVFKHMLSALAAHYNYVLIDAGPAFSEPLLAACEVADLLLLVCEPEALLNYKTKWVLTTLDGLAFPESMVKIILTHAEPLSRLPQSLAYQVLGSVPTDSRAGLEAYHQLAQSLESCPATTRRSQAPGAHAGQQAFARWVSRHVMAPVPVSSANTVSDEVAQIKRRIHAQLLEVNEFKSPELATATEKQWAEMRQKAERMIATMVARETAELLGARAVREHLVKEIVDEALGLGPLEDLLADSEVTDILVNGKDEIYVERHGKLCLTTRQFDSTDQLRMVIERILSPLGRRIDELMPMADARLPDGARINAVIPPLAVGGPVLSIRKFAPVRSTQEDLIRFGTLTPGMAEFLRACVRARKNILICGGAGSGKTTLLNTLCGFVPEQERIITIEDAAEFRLARRHWVALESRPRNIEGKGQVSIRDLFSNALHMRPDRIIVGECRGAETLDMLQAMNSGHEGSMTTIHANSPRDVVFRIDSMVLMSDIDLPVRAVRQMVASAIQLIIHTQRLSDGSRKIMAISELTREGWDRDPELRELFAFHQHPMGLDGAVTGTFERSPQPPTFWAQLQALGVVQGSWGADGDAVGAER